MERLHILDGYGYVFRAFYGLATAGRDRQGVHLSTSTGMPTGALYVYASMLVRLHKELHPDRIVVVFDAPGPTFRDELDSDYKATRKETPEDLRAQMPHFRPLTEAFCWPTVAVAGVEADDVIATITARARARGWDVVILSGDKDLMQMVDEHVVVVDSMRQITYDRQRVIEKFGVEPSQVADWLALVGDSSDNVPGMAGVGKVTAAKLLGQYGSIDGILDHTGDLKGKQRERFEDAEQLERLALSRKLVALKTDVELPVGLDDLVPRAWDGAALSELFHQFEFDALLTRLGPISTSDAGGEAAPALEGAAAEDGPGAATEPQIVLDSDQLAGAAAAARAAGRVGVHLVTDGQRPDRAHVVGLALATPGRAPHYLPLAHRYLGVPAQLAADALGPLRELFADQAVVVSCYDAKAHHHHLADLGIEIATVGCDALIAAYLLDSSREPELPAVAERWAGVSVPAVSAVLGKGKSAATFDSVRIEDAALYATSVARAAEKMAGSLGAALEGDELTPLWRDVERPLSRVLAGLERRGIAIDTDYLAELSADVAGRIARCEQRVFELAGEQINLGSPKQLAALLFDKLGLRSERMKKTKTGYSTDHEVLEGMRHEHEIVDPILEHRELVKLKGTYIDALPPLVNPDTGRLHTTFRQAVAATGRLSSQDPNLQNIPIRTELGRKIRGAFVAGPGQVLVSADYSQIELRVMAHLSEDPVLTRAFLEGADIHTETAAEVFSMERSQVGASERRVAKAVNYGLIYGQSDFGLSRALGIPRPVAREYIDRYFERFSKVRDFMQVAVDSARRAGAATTVLGRRRPIPELSSKNFRQRSAAERIAQNTPIQGSAADIMKVAMLRCDECLSSVPGGAAMLLTVHDELVFEVDRECADQLAAEVRARMESAFELSVPLVVDVGIGDNWADAH